MARKTRRQPKHYTTVEREAYGQTLEVEVEVEYEYEPGEPTVMWGDNAHPGCDASVELGDATVKANGEAITLTEEEQGWIRDEILDSYED